MKKLNVNFPRNIARVEAAMKRKFAIRSIFYRLVFRGKGLEFESYRKYSEGDDVSLIDWKASKRTSQLLVKQYIEERDLKIFIILDVGESMICGSTKRLKNEVAAEIAAALAHLILVSGDEVGFALYSNKVKKMRMFEGGLNQFYRFERLLRDPKIYGGKTYLKKTLDFLEPYLRKAMAVFIISDFLNLDKAAFKTLEDFVVRRETIGIMVRDPIDVEMPDLNKEVIVEDIYTGKQLLINPSLIKYKYREYALEQKRKVEEVFKKANSDLIEIYTNEDFVISLTNFLKMRIKKRKIIMPQR